MLILLFSFYYLISNARRATSSNLVFAWLFVFGQDFPNSWWLSCSLIHLISTRVPCIDACLEILYPKSFRLMVSLAHLINGLRFIVRITLTLETLRTMFIFSPGGWIFDLIDLHFHHCCLLTQPRFSQKPKKFEKFWKIFKEKAQKNEKI